MSEIRIPPGDGGPAPKPWYRSATLWTNGAAIVAALGMLVSGQADLQKFVAEVFPLLLAILNIFLRFKTKTAVTK